MNYATSQPKIPFSYYIAFIIIPLTFIYYEFLFIKFGDFTVGNIRTIMLFATAFGFFASIFNFLIPYKKHRFLYINLILFIAAIYFITECFIGKVFQTFMTPQAIFTGAGNVAEDFTNEVITTITSGWYIILFYFLPIIVIYLFRKKLVLHHKRRSSSFYSFLFAVFFFVAGYYVAIQEPAYMDEYHFDASMRKLGVYTTLTAEIKHSLSDSNTDFVIPEETTTVDTEEVIEEEEVIVYEKNTMDIDFNTLASSTSETAVANLDTYLAAQKGALQNEYTGLFEGKNLILVTAEAFSHFAVSEELTPTLYRMMHNGIYFSDYYQPAWGGSTSTGEYSVLTGLIPTEGVSSIRITEGHNLYLTIGNQLTRAGYHTAAYHNNSYTYYSRNTTHTNFGYSSFTGMGNGMENGVINCWPESDLEMIDFTVPQYIDQQPFSIYYMTVSGHCAYSQGGNAMSKKNWEAVQNLTCSDTLKAYYASQLELEYAMASLIAQLDTAGILNDTVICLTSDHYPYGLEAGETWGNTQNYLPELYGCTEAELNKFTQDQNAWILWSGCLENELSDYAVEISEPTYSLDILPTLSNLFGVEYDSRMLVGRDVFSEEEALVIWPDYSWKTDLATYQASSGTVTAIGDEIVSDDYVARIKAVVQNKFNLSDITLNYDYWNHVFGN